MNIAFVTTQSFAQSTLIGRIVPLANELAEKGTVMLLVHSESGKKQVDVPVLRENITYKIIGKNPFSRNASGKKRSQGIFLVANMAINAIRSAIALIRLNPDVVVISKPLPENTLAVALWRILNWRGKVTVDVDDFELLANKLTSLMQRAAVHWSERMATMMASHIIVATPFLVDYMSGLTSHTVPVTLIPTGYSPLGETYVHGTNPVMLYMGSVSSSSGHKVDMLPTILQEVRRSVPNASLVIAGSGDDEENLKAEFKKLGLSDLVKWFGRFSPQDIKELVSQSSIIIDPIDGSIVSRAKSSFRTMLACSIGMPIVTSNIGIRPSIIPSEFHERFFANAQDSKDYADKVVVLVQNPLSKEEEARMQEKSSEYLWSNLAQQYHSCIL